MNRLTDIYLGSTHSQICYDPLGRMTSKQADGQTVFANANFTGTQGQPARPHAMKSAETTANMFPAASQAVTYTGFDKVKTIHEGGNGLEYTYGYDRQRIRMTDTVGGTIRNKDYVGMCEYLTEDDGNAVTTKTRTYLAGPFGVFAVVEQRDNEETIHYILKDNLGSWTTIIDGEGNVEQELSFDAWGNLRNPETWSGSSSAQPMFDRGYTGHELLQAFNLINMNGRMYDPLMSSFLSVDAIVNDPTSAQGFNRYAYCMYNPLKYTDPSGWTMQGGMKPRNPFHDDWSASHVIPTHGASDFSNPYYLCNMAFYGNLDGPQCKVGGSGGGGFSMDELVGTYGYQVTYRSNSVYNYSFPSTQLQLIRNWQFNPCRNTNKDIRDAGITDLTVGVVNYGGGVSTSFYQWGCASGQSHSASVWYEPAGSDNKGCFSMSNQPLWMYNDCSNNAPPPKH